MTAQEIGTKLAPFAVSQTAVFLVKQFGLTDLHWVHDYNGTVAR
jgi:hypothetical protein